MNLEQLAQVLAACGCPEAKATTMAAQLDRRARQLAQEKGRSYEAALAHLLRLFEQSWAAREREGGDRS